MLQNGLQALNFKIKALVHVPQLSPGFWVLNRYLQTIFANKEVKRKTTVIFFFQRVTMIQGIQLDKEKIIQDWKESIDLDKLTDDHKIIHNAHINAVKAGKEAYNDPFTGFEVFSILAHLNRGYCCGNACRHCPFQHVMVEAKYRNLKKHNTAFYA